MIAHIQGRLVEKTPTEVIIDCNGVGYHINISLHTYSLLPDSESLKLFTFLQIREDAHTLYGFVEKQERELFKLLLSVSGVGASTARTMLSSLAPGQIIQAIASNDLGTMQSMKGIGAKKKQPMLSIRMSILNLLDTRYISDAQNNDRFTGQTTNSFDAQSAAVFYGLGRRYNASLQIKF